MFDDMPAGLAGARMVVSQFVIPGADHNALVAALEPAAQDYDTYFEPDFAPMARARYHALWSTEEKGLAPGPKQTDMLIFEATVSDLRAQNERAYHFPGGYRTASHRIKLGNTLYFFKFVEPGERTGLTVDGLTHVNGHWVLFPKPWRLLE